MRGLVDVTMIAAIVAAYAALVATASLGWQIYTWWHRRKSHVEVSASIAILGFSTGAKQAIGIDVTNHGDHAIRVTGAGLEMQDGSDAQLHILNPPPGATIPGTIQPRDSAKTWIEQAEYEEQGISPFEPVTAWAQLATGEFIRSRTAPIMSRE